LCVRLYCTVPGMETLELIRQNKLPRKQTGERIETKTAWDLSLLRCDRERTQTEVYHPRPKTTSIVHGPTWSRSSGMHSESMPATSWITGQRALLGFIERVHFPWCEANRSASTVNGNKRTWHCYLEPHLDGATLVNPTTAQVTVILTHASCQEWIRPPYSELHQVHAQRRLRIRHIN